MRTEISSLGEFGLIRRLTDGIELKNESSRYGVGDDAAVLSYPTEKQVLITTDLLMEGVKLIGHITKPELGCALITRDGQEFELKAQGWNPLKEETTESEGEKAGE